MLQKPGTATELLGAVCIASHMHRMVLLFLNTFLQELLLGASTLDSCPYPIVTESTCTELCTPCLPDPIQPLTPGGVQRPANLRLPMGKADQAPVLISTFRCSGTWVLCDFDCRLNVFVNRTYARAVAHVDINEH